MVTPTPAERGLQLPVPWQCETAMCPDLYTADQMREMYQRGLADGPNVGSWVAADDVYRHARSIDVALNGEEGEASRPALCDVVSQIASLARQYGPLVRALSARPLPSDWVAGLRGEVTDVRHGGFATISVDCSHLGPHILSKGDTFTLLNDKAKAAPSAPAEGGEHREIIPVGPEDGWCTRCGCGNDSANFAHLPSCKTAPEPLAQGPMPVCGDEAWAIRRPDGRVELVSIRATESAAQWAIGSWPQMQRDGFTCERIAIYPYASTQPAAEVGPAEGCEDCAYNGRYLCDTHGPPNPPQPSASVGGRQPTTSDVIDSLKKLASMRPNPGDPPQVERMFDAACVFFVLAYAEYIESALTTAAAGGGEVGNG